MGKRARDGASWFAFGGIGRQGQGEATACPWASGPQVQREGPRGPSRTCCPGAQRKVSVPTRRPPEAQDAVGAPAFGVPVRHGGWAGLGLCVGPGEAAECMSSPETRVRFPLTAWTLVSGLQVRPRAAPGAPALLRGGHGSPERLGEHGPAHLRPLQPGQWGHAGGRSPGTPPGALQGAVWVSAGARMESH